MPVHNRSLILSVRLTEFLALCSKHHQVNDVPVLAHPSVSKICLRKIELTGSCLFFCTVFSVPDEGKSDLPDMDTLNKTVLFSKLLQPLFFL